MLMNLVLQAQTGIGTDNPHASAALELSSSSKALVYPQMTSLQRLAIVPVEGLQVYDTDLNRLMLYANSKWGGLNTVNINSSITAVVNYSDMPSTGLTSQDLTSPVILHNAEGWVATGATANTLKFLRAGKYDVTLYATVERTSGSNSYVSLEFKLPDDSQVNKALIDLPGGISAINSVSSRWIINVAKDGEYMLAYKKIAEATAGSPHKVTKVMVVIKVVE